MGRAGFRLDAGAEVSKGPMQELRPRTDMEAALAVSGHTLPRKWNLIPEQMERDHVTDWRARKSQLLVEQRMQMGVRVDRERGRAWGPA